MRIVFGWENMGVYCILLLLIGVSSGDGVEVIVDRVMFKIA